jgi:hypothetical protein
MTMLTQARGPFERTPDSSGDRGFAKTASPGAYLARIKRFCVGVVTILATGCAVAAVMALKIAIYLPQLIHR